jgi:hypothetical protein
MLVTAQNDSTASLAQRLVDAPWMNTVPPGISIDQRDHIPTEEPSGYYFANPPQLSLQERGERISHCLPNSPPTGQSLV